MRWLRTLIEPAKCPSDDISPASGEPEKEPKRLTGKLADDFIAYHTICAKHGFDSMQAAEFLQSRKDDLRFQRLARGLNRLIMNAYLERSGDQGQSH